SRVPRLPSQNTPNDRHDQGSKPRGLASHTIVCKNPHMATNLAIDDELLEEALKVGGQRTKKATVTQALEEYIQHRRQADVLKQFGKIEMDPDYNYKAQRRRK